MKSLIAFSSLKTLFFCSSQVAKFWSVITTNSHWGTINSSWKWWRSSWWQNQWRTWIDLVKNTSEKTQRKASEGRKSKPKTKWFCSDEEALLLIKYWKTGELLHNAKSEKYYITNKKMKSLKDTMKAYFCSRHTLFSTTTLSSLFYLF